MSDFIDGMDYMEKYYLKHNTERQQNEYFIDPYGKIIRYSGELNESIISFHTEIASQEFPEISNPKDYMMKLGYVMVGSSVYHCPIIHKKPTQAQINALYDLGLYGRLCFLHNGTYPNYEKYSILCE